MQCQPKITNPTCQVKQLLAHINIVMVNTTLPANIGSAARAMHTMGFSRLTIVNPKHPIDETSMAYSAGGRAILEQALIVDTLEEAVKDSQLIFAASSRLRHLPRPMVTPQQSAKIIKHFYQAQHKQPANIAILFGREDRGLTNKELAYADYHIQITANPDYPVLNVASAIQVITSFLYDYFSQTITPNDKQLDDHHSLQLQINLRQTWDEPAITHQQSQQLNQRIIELMVKHQLADPNDLKSLPQRLSRLTSRLQLDQKEYQLINSIISKLI